MIMWPWTPAQSPWRVTTRGNGTGPAAHQHRTITDPKRANGKRLLPPQRSAFAARRKWVADDISQQAAMIAAGRVMAALNEFDYWPGSAQKARCRSRRADRNLDQIRSAERNSRLKCRCNLRCSIDSLGGDAHGRGKRYKIDGWVNDVHGDEAISTRRRIMWL